jgi:hypothetical protein
MEILEWRNNMIVGAYTLELYCDNEEGNKTHMRVSSGDYGFILYVKEKKINFQFVGKTFSDCAKQAIKYGWLVDKKNDHCLCPICHKNNIKYLLTNGE